MIDRNADETLADHADRLVAAGDECCQTCRFSFPIDQNNGQLFHFPDHHLLCRRYAPMNPGAYSTGLPVAPNCWCGEYERGAMGKKAIDL